MGIRKYAALFAALFVTVFLTAAANAADETKAYYLVQGTYNETDSTYTVDIYLNTKVYLAAGTFGMTYRENVPVPESGAVIDTAGFERLDADPFKAQETVFKNNRQIVFQWGMNEADITDWTSIRLAGFTMTGISRETAESWGEQPFELLDWLTTDLSKTAEFTDTDDGYATPLNREIWRVSSSEEQENGAQIGYYQGYDYNAGEWTDIGFRFKSNLDSKIKLKVVINAYNPKNDPVLLAYKSDNEVFEGVMENRTIYPDGRVKYIYDVETDDTGVYTLVVRKKAHLTYVRSIDIPYTVTDEYALPEEITLLCGDINGDEYIKIPDRSHLILMLNHPARNNQNTAEFDLADLNGDGRITLTDLNILKSNIDKTYN